MLSRFGPYATPALPQAIELLSDTRDEYWFAGLQIIAALGEEGKTALPRLIERYAAKKGQAPYEALTIAAIGPPAAEAAEVLEKYATPDSRYLADAYYALFCIRGDVADLENMVALLRRDDLNRPLQKKYVVGYLNALGVRAAPVMGQVKELIESQDVDTPHLVDGLKTFIERVDRGKDAHTLLPR